jgi:uncharacterized membrane protein
LKKNNKQAKVIKRRGQISHAIRRTVETGAPKARLAWLDSLRGVAILLMIGYHLCFDLAFFHKLDADFNHDPFWLASRALIVTLFLAAVGVSLALAISQSSFARRFLRREFAIGACALAVSAGSYLMFPHTFIFFGILHFIFVASLLGAWLLRMGLPAMVFALLGVGALVLGQVASPVFDAVPWQWLGMMSHKPATEDYVPLFPWIGVVLLGIAAGKSLRLWPAAVSVRRVTGMPLTLAWLGRHSLIIYMLHQPILLGSLYLFTQV